MMWRKSRQTPAVSLATASLVPEVRFTLTEWKKVVKEHKLDCVLIGGVALSFYVKPRYTEDLDFLFLHRSAIPAAVNGFKRIRPGAFQENKTHIPVEVVTPTSFYPELPIDLVAKVLDTAIIVDGLKVASREGMIALKLCSAEKPDRYHKDVADLEGLVRSNMSVTMQDWPLSQDNRDLFAKVKRDVQLWT